MNKIVLGTAQFGMYYGINNKKGQITQAEAFEILNTAYDSGVEIVDTAYVYGNSEAVLGNFMKINHKKLKIISKLPDCENEQVKNIVDASRKRLGIAKFYGYLIHDFLGYSKNQSLWDELEKLKNAGIIEKIGFSLYFPSEIEFVLKQGLQVDMIQFPYSIFDQRFQPYFFELKKRKIEIYVRSVFLQGLVFKKPIELENNFGGLRDNLGKLNSLSKESGIPVFALCFNFAAKNELIDEVVVGIDTIQHLNEIMQALDFLPKLDTFLVKFSDLKVDDERILLPFNWSPHLSVQ